jgi:hypothetical protein
MIRLCLRSMNLGVMEGVLVGSVLLCRCCTVLMMEMACVAPLLIPHGPSLAQEGGGGECTLVVDTGFSFTHIVPVLRGAIVSSSVRRSVPPPVLPCFELLLTGMHEQDRHWRQAPHQPPEGTHIVPTVVHDGPNERR